VRGPQEEKSTAREQKERDTGLKKCPAKLHISSLSGGCFFKKSIRDYAEQGTAGAIRRAMQKSLETRENTEVFAFHRKVERVINQKMEAAFLPQPAALP
jgi:hypothetical protein